LELSLAEAFNKTQFSNAAASTAFAIPDMTFLYLRRAQPHAAPLVKYIAPDF